MSEPGSTSRAAPRALPGKHVAAGVLFRDRVNRVLLVEPTYKPNWEIPGGVVEADEAPWAAASRELAEELGWDRPVGSTRWRRRGARSSRCWPTGSLPRWRRWSRA